MLERKNNDDHYILIKDEDSAESDHTVIEINTIFNDLEAALIIINEKLQGVHKSQALFLKWGFGFGSLISGGCLIDGLVEQSVGLSICCSVILLGNLGLFYTGFKPNSWLYRKMLDSTFLQTTGLEYCGFPTDHPNIRMARILNPEERKQISNTIEKYNDFGFLEEKNKIKSSLEKKDYTKLRDELLLAIKNKHIYYKRCTDVGMRFLHEAKNHLFFTKDIPASVVHPILEYLDCPDPRQLLKISKIK
jgi:hypothetical protein